MALTSETRAANENVAVEDDLRRQILQMEMQAAAWIFTATALYGSVDTGDQAMVLAMRDDLIARLAAATAI